MPTRAQVMLDEIERRIGLARNASLVVQVAVESDFGEQARAIAARNFVQTLSDVVVLTLILMLPPDDEELAEKMCGYVFAAARKAISDQPVIH